MSVKKLLILAAAGIVSTSALAGGASNYSAPAAAMSSDDQVGLYVGVNAGWAQTNWRAAAGGSSTAWNNAGQTNGSFAGGLDVGYSFNQYLALELGGIYLPTEAKYSGLASGASWQTWDLYLAGKGTMSLYEDLNVFGKFGVAYSNVSYSGPSTSSTFIATSNQNNWEPLFAVGLGYDFAQDWNVNGQYMYIMGAQSDAGVTNGAPQNIFTLGVAYTFAM